MKSLHTVYEHYLVHLLQIPCGVTYPVSSRTLTDSAQYTVGYSESSLIHSVQPSDCNMFKICYGGVTMKLMDEVAGIVAFRHVRQNIVTISIGKNIDCL